MALARIMMCEFSTLAPMWQGGERKDIFLCARTKRSARKVERAEELKSLGHPYACVHRKTPIICEVIDT